jgi:hypothetical protein
MAETTVLNLIETQSVVQGVRQRICRRSVRSLCAECANDREYNVLQLRVSYSEQLPAVDSVLKWTSS